MTRLQYHSESRTIWIVDAPGAVSRSYLHTPAGPHLLIKNEPRPGETIVARIRVRPIRWEDPTSEESMVTAWHASLVQDAQWSPSVRLIRRPAYGRQLGDDSDAPEEEDITAELLGEILSGVEWETASVRAEMVPDGPTSIEIEREPT